MTIYGQLACGTTHPKPEIEYIMPQDNSNGIALIICPGGGYGKLAEHEGKGYADYFSRAGFSCFVLNYRLGTDGYTHPAMLEDALAAINTIRSRADEFTIDPDKIGILGSSAGGHLAAHTMIAHHHYAGDGSLRPDFGVLCYPVILSSGVFAHNGSIKNLAGPDASGELLESLSCEKHVISGTPPCFLWHTNEDTAVPAENSVAFASALRAYNVGCELHIYEKGRHGLGLNTPFDWGSECIRWINGLF